MVLSANFATGLVFGALNLPLIRLALAGGSGMTLSALVNGVEAFWFKALPKEIGVGLVLVGALCVLTVGLVLQPVAVVLVTGIGSIVVRVMPSASRRSIGPYLPPVFFGDGYVRFADWIH